MAGMQRVGTFAALVLQAHVATAAHAQALVAPAGDVCSAGKPGCMPLAPVSKMHGGVNATGCCESCAQMAGCRAWSLVVDDRGQSSCQLSAREAPLDLHSGNCTSGIVRPTPPAPAPRPAPQGAKNVLLIVVDDLRQHPSAAHAGHGSRRPAGPPPAP